MLTYANVCRYLGMLSYQDPQRMLIRVVRETFVYKNRQFCLNHVLGMAPAAAAATVLNLLALQVQRYRY